VAVLVQQQTEMQVLLTQVVVADLVDPQELLIQVEQVVQEL
jgi:hypothetical protein|tara:strand:+ start:654 stop:776 length:123 start_codon:yes stop_codon:yes gene_type:complete